MGLRFLLLFAVMIFSPVTYAAEKSIKLDGRIMESCGYFSAWNGEFNLTYFNNALPWGTKVEAVYGFHGWTSESNGQTRDWIITRTSELKAVSPYTWAIRLAEPVAVRSERWFDQLQFAIKYTLPGGDSFYDKGSNSSFGYYSADILSDSGHGCQGDNVPYKMLTLVAVARD